MTANVVASDDLHLVLHSSGGHKFNTGLAGLKLRCLQGHLFSGGSRGNVCLVLFSAAFPSFQKPPVFLGPWPLTPSSKPAMAESHIALLGRWLS